MASGAALARHVLLPPREFERGVWDCCSWMADWVEISSGAKIGRSWLGSPLTDKEALRILRDHGGMSAIVDKAMLEARWVRVPSPWRDGDVCLLRGHNQRKELHVTVGIYRKGRVVTVAETGAFRLIDPKFIERGYRWE